MTVTGVTGATSNSQAFSSGVAQSMGNLQDQFMKILLTELRYQDPMDPMKDRDFFTQMAQFTTATQMEDLNTGMAQMMAVLYEGQMSQNLLSAASLIGRQFEATVDGVTLLGVVEAVAVRDFQIVVRSGDHEIPADYLTLIGGFEDAGQDSQQ